MGDLDGIIERNGNILVLEWKAGADLDAFDSIHMAQLITAKAFTANSEKHQLVVCHRQPSNDGSATRSLREVRRLGGRVGQIST